MRTPPASPWQPAPAWGTQTSLQPRSPPSPALPAVTDADIQKLPLGRLTAMSHHCSAHTHTHTPALLHRHVHTRTHVATTCCTVHALACLHACTHMLQTCSQLHMPGRTCAHRARVQRPPPEEASACIHTHCTGAQCHHRAASHGHTHLQLPQQLRLTARLQVFEGLPKRAPEALLAAGARGWAAT